MYCPKCGNEISKTSRFCGGCGAENPVYADGMPGAVSLEEMPKKSGKRKKLILIVASIAAVLLLAYLLFGGKSIDLKYDWGTDMQSIESEEWVEEIDSHFSEPGVYIYVYDENHEVDQMEEFQIDDDVMYGFYDDELALISYDIDMMGMSYEDMIEIVVEHYGDDYYQMGDYRTYWWIDDTVVRLDDYGSLCYYWDKCYGDVTGGFDADEVREYFGK